MPNSDRILLVEDDRHSMEGLFLLLSGEGFSVVTASNGQQALDLLIRAIQPRLLILDLVLPKVQGREILKYVQSDPSLRNMPVVVITALQDVTVVADAVFYKPIDCQALLTTVRRLMTTPQRAAS